MARVDPSDVGRLPPEDRAVHVGNHHYAPCGEWRPRPGNRECPYCPERCPGCGASYHRREGGG